MPLWCAVGVKTTCFHGRSLGCGWPSLAKSFPLAVALTSTALSPGMITLTADSTSTVSHLAVLQLQWASRVMGRYPRSVAPQKVLGTPSLGREHLACNQPRPNPRDWQASPCVLTKAQLSLLLMSPCCRHRYTANCPPPPSPPDRGLLISVIWIMVQCRICTAVKKYFGSCRLGFPPGGGSQSTIFNQSWMHLRQSKAGVQSLSKGTAGTVPNRVTRNKNAPLLIAGRGCTASLQPLADNKTLWFLVMPK